MRLASTAATWARLHVVHRRELELYRKYSGRTMLRDTRFVHTLVLCRRSLPAGDIVECGTWRGGMSAALAEVLPGRRSMLFDSFEGLPDPGEEDDRRAHEYVEKERLAVDEGEALASMRLSGSRDFHIRKGWFDETVPVYAAEQRPVAVLRLDGDWYDSTMLCLEQLFPRVVPGGLILVDDYYDWPGCRRAVHDYLSKEKCQEPIRATPYRVVFIDKE